MTAYLVTVSFCMDDITLEQAAQIADVARSSWELNVLSALDRHGATEEDIEHLNDNIRVFVSVAEQETPIVFK